MLSALAIAVFLWILPDITRRAVDDSAALGLQAAISTIVLYLTLVAGFAGLRAGAADGDLGAAPEWRTSPLSPGAYVAGRFAGIVAIAVALLAVLLPLLVTSQLDTLQDQPPELRVTALTLVGALAGAAQVAAVGLLLATITTPQLAAVLFLGLLVAGRAVVPALTAQSGTLANLAGLLPDPARLDLSRELAFHRPIDTASTCWAFASAALSTVACLSTAAWALRRRET